MADWKVFGDIVGVVKATERREAKKRDAAIGVTTKKGFWNVKANDFGV